MAIRGGGPSKELKKYNCLKEILVIYLILSTDSQALVSKIIVELILLTTIQ